MAFTSNEGGAPMSEINVTPLVDVMLVLLIIFMITMPLTSERIQIDLPQKSTVKNDKEPPPPIQLTINSGGALFWDGQPLTQDLFELQLQFEAKKDPQPMLQIKADPFTEYQVLADVMGSAKNMGMTKIGFESFTAAN
jgi:biopolymer transport protein ExbD